MLGDKQKLSPKTAFIVVLITIDWRNKPAFFKKLFEKFWFTSEDAVSHEAAYEKNLV